MRFHRGARDRLTVTGSAFTLVEVVVVLLLLATLAATVTISLAAARSASRLDDAIERLKDYDAAARERARSSGRALRLRFQSGTDRVWRLDARTGRPEGAALEFDGGVAVERVISDGREAATHEIVCSSRGQTETYAVLLAGPRGTRQWVLFVGLTGESRTLQNDAQLHEIFEMLSFGGNDAR